MEGRDSSPEQPGRFDLTSEDVAELQEMVRTTDLSQGFMEREEEVWPDRKGKTIRWPDGKEIKVSFEDVEEDNGGR